MDRQRDRQMDGQTDGRTEGRTDGQTDGRTDGQTDGRTARVIPQTCLRNNNLTLVTFEDKLASCITIIRLAY